MSLKYANTCKLRLVIKINLIDIFQEVEFIMNLFDEIKAVFTKKDVKFSSPYMVNRFISFSPFFWVIERMNKFVNLPQWAISSLYKHSFPKMNEAPYMRYIKIPNDMKKNAKLIPKICTSLCCSKDSAREFIMLLELKGYEPWKFFGLKKGE